MKQILIITLFLFSGMHCFSQKYIDKIVEESCECLERVPDSLSNRDFNMQAGICMIKASMPYKEQLKKDYNINLDKINSKEEGEKLGKLIAIKLISVCPNAFKRLTKRAQEENIKKEENKKIIEGTVSSIEKNPFVVFSLKDDFGRIFKFYWLSFIESDIELTNNYDTLTGKTIRLTYEKKDFFDPKIVEYRSFNVISKIETINE